MTIKKLIDELKNHGYAIYFEGENLRYKFLALMSLLHKYHLCFDKLSMNGKKFNDFNICPVRPEPVEGQNSGLCNRL